MGKMADKVADKVPGMHSRGEGGEGGMGDQVHCMPSMLCGCGGVLRYCHCCACPGSL
jgi:hypothetical protein